MNQSLSSNKSTEDRPVTGFLLAMTTVIFWGALPVSLKQITDIVDPITVVWTRFGTAAIWLWLTLPHYSQDQSDRDQSKPKHSFWTGRLMLLTGIACAGLCANFVLFNASVDLATPSATQLVSQSGPMFLILGSVLVLNESLHRIQIFGIFVLLAGFALFFNDRLPVLLDLDKSLGLLLAVLGSLVWAIYGVAQKIILREMPPARLMRLIYTGSALVLTPFASPSLFFNLSLFQLFCLAFCCMNTLVAYGAFSKAMTCWHTAKVSAVLTLTPLFTLLFSLLFHFIWPHIFAAEQTNLLGCFGALVVVSGAGLIAIGPLLHLPKHSN